MKYSCGILFVQDGKILLGHPTGQSHWDIPKGKMEEGETFLEASIRECYEEIGVKVLESELTFLANVPYQKGKKRLVLFVYTSSILPDINDLQCNSIYVTKFGNLRPEFDDFEYVSFEEATNRLTPRMCRSIVNAIQEYKKRDIK